MARPPKDQSPDIAGRAVAVTIDLLATRGASSLTMAEVAQAIGCRAPAIYNHFRNKDSLLRAVRDTGFRMLHQEKQDIAARTHGNALSRLREGGIAYLRFALKHPSLYGLMFAPPAVNGLEESPFLSDPGLGTFEFLKDSVRSCQEEGYALGLAPDHLAFVLWSSVHGIASLMLHGHVPPCDLQDLEQLLTSSIDLVIGFIAGTKHNAGPEQSL